MIYYTGIDYHKRYSVACTLDAQGHKIREARIDANAPAAFAAYFKALDKPSKVTMEACWNWGVLHDLLETLENVEEVILSNPAKNRIIAESMHKNDRFDAFCLATLLRGDFISRVHVPSREVRGKKNLVRQRQWLARVRTMVRNRIHSLIDRHPLLPRPAVKDIFCMRGVHWLNEAPLPGDERLLLDDDLQMHTTLNTQIKAMEKRISEVNIDNETLRRIQTLPGIGAILAPLIALEIDDPKRFPSADKFCAYAGLVPTTRASGGKISHGGLLPFCNKWLRWAFIEGAWVAIVCSPYFGAFYKRHRARSKGANNAITITARRMAQIAWKMLDEKRDYSEEPPPPKNARENNFPGRSGIGLMV
jgi:transposase